ncbi:MAG: C_GCAxxG_C_C family protein [Firmicutes bacterium]|nr:C_GCAxxG_C_C family protein [Bacillota bacterium]
MAKDLAPAEVAANFGMGVNCCMQVFSAVAEDIGLSEEEACRIGAGFGGGMGLGSTCGCVTGALMALGYKYGNDGPGQKEKIAVYNEKKRAFLQAFKEECGSTVCPELLDGLNPAVPADKAVIVERGLMKEVCAPAVCTAVDILADLL